MLFLERAIGLLAPGGALGALLPAKMLRSLYAGPARRILLRSMRIVRIDDYSLDQRALFEADAFAMTLVAVNPGAEDGRNETRPPPGRRSEDLQITLHRPGRRPLRFGMTPTDLPLVRDEPASPWLLAPRAVRDVLRRMQASGTPLGQVAGLRIRRGIETGANDVLVVREVVPRLGGLASVRADGAFRSGAGLVSPADFEATIEDAALWPLVRGTDLMAWSFDVRRYLIRPEPVDRSSVQYPRLCRYLERHQARLRRRRRAVNRTPSHRISTGHRVAWHDLADTLRAVAMPLSVRTAFGDERTPVPLNTVYQVEVADHAEALRVAAFLNSTPIRVFAATIAERAKDAHFRFFAWTVSVLPLPDALQNGGDARAIEQISRDAHARGDITGPEQDRLDAIVARGFGLTQAELAALVRFGRWLRGQEP